MVDQHIPEHLRTEKLDMSSFASDDNLQKAKTMALEYAELEKKIKDTEAELESWKARRQELARKEIPEFFDNVVKTDRIGVPEAGVDVKVVPYYHANIKSDWPEDQRLKAFNYLEQSGHGDVVAVVVSVKFRRGELPLARELEQLIKSSKTGNSHPPSLEMGVPWNTLTALVREQVENGESVDLDVLGATVGRTAKIEKRKK